MKKITVLAFIAIACSTIVTAQIYKPRSGFRMLRPDEIAFLNNLHQSLYDAIPHEYKNWTPNGDSKEFSAVKFWCPEETEYDKCTGICPTTLGTVEPYTLGINMDFTMTNEESGPLMGAAVAGITDYTNGSQIAKALKSTAKSKVSIRIYSNTYAADGLFKSSVFGFSYCPKTPTTNIPVPIPAALAVKGLRSEACPILDESTKQVSMRGNYYDNAFFVLGKSTVKKSEKQYGDGLVTNDYAISFDKTKIGKLINQNIVIKITGDAADIDAIVKLIDWKKLDSILAK